MKVGFCFYSLRGTKIMNPKIEVLQGDITAVDVDVIVNAANTSLLGGSGVDGAIHRKGGAALQDDCRRLRNEVGKGRTGGTYLSIGGNLPAKFVIHAIGPTWTKGNEQHAREVLKQVYLDCLEMAVKNGLTSIAFPNISTGRYGFPKDEAAQIAVSAVKQFLSDDQTIEQVLFVCFEDDNYQLYKDLV